MNSSKEALFYESMNNALKGVSFDLFIKSLPVDHYNFLESCSGGKRTVSYSVQYRYCHVDFTVNFVENIFFSKEWHYVSHKPW
mgnify:CR=1 FL=1